MGIPVTTRGDRNERQAPLMLGCNQTVLVEKKPVGVRSMSNVLPHPGHNPKQPHPMNPLRQGDQSVLVGGKPIGYKGIIDNCQHKMVYVQNTTVLVKGG